MNVRKLVTRLSRRLQLPTDVAAELPRIELRGFEECSLDCHQGILEYGTEEIVIALNIGVLTIRGCGLELQQMHRERLTVTGTILELSMTGGKG